MLPIAIPGVECYDEKNNEFVYVSGQTLQLEHSLLSISKWESKWKRSFINNGPKNWEETIDYVRCMTINKNVDPDIYLAIQNPQMEEIKAYINDSMTATTIKERPGARHSRDIVTSELIYYWMIDFGIPFECEKWHLNRLLMLIRVCGEKNTPGKKMSQRENIQQMHALNAARKAKSHSRG